MTPIEQDAQAAATAKRDRRIAAIGPHPFAWSEHGCTVCGEGAYAKQHTGSAAA